MTKDVQKAVAEGRLCWCGVDHEKGSLMDLWHAIYTHPVTCTNILFPWTPRGAMATTRALGNLASNLHTARLCEERGDQTGATCYRGICEDIVSMLPDYAKGVASALQDSHPVYSWGMLQKAANKNEEDWKS
jgi:hypothetical protein